MFRRYNRWHSRFDQPDPYDGSYELGDPQSLNRYAYVQNDPVNFRDPEGLKKCKDIYGVEYECPSDGPLDVVTINALGWSVLPAWMSGHSPMIIGLLPADPTPREPTGPLKPTRQMNVCVCEYWRRRSVDWRHCRFQQPSVSSFRN
jgi:hypothetical protein